MTSPPPKRRSPLVAVILSGLFPGLGQLYNGERKKALLFILAAVIVFGLLSPLDIDIDPDAPAAGLVKVLLATLPFLVIAGWSVIDALRVARRSAAA